MAARVAAKWLYLSVTSAAFAVPTSALADEARIDSRCPRLSAPELDELNARVMLRLAAAPQPHAPPVVVCTAESSWLEWEGRRLELPGRTGLVDEVVEVVDLALQPDAPVSVAERPTPAPAPPRASPAPPPADLRPAQTATPRATRNRGGIAVGFESELPSHHVGSAFGPSFDEGLNVGPLSVGARQAFRFTTTRPQVSFMDFEGTIGLGAPLRKGEPLGAVARFGVECLVGHPRGKAEVGAAPVLSLGLRAARDFDVVGLWLGVDARLRLSTLSAGSLDPIVASQLTASLSVGVSFLDSTRGAGRK